MLKRIAVCLCSAVLSVHAQTTNRVDFDTAGNWTAGSGSITSYQADHVYEEAGLRFTGGKTLRQSTTAQDGHAGALGTYAWRLNTGATVAWTATLTQALGANEIIGSFGFDARRWDGAPSPAFTVDYSFDGGGHWIVCTNLDNAALGNSSDWTTFSCPVASPAGLAASQFIVRFTDSVGERIMVDNFFYSTAENQGGGSEVQAVQGFDAVAAGAGRINLAWMLNTHGDAVVVARSTQEVFGTPANGTAYALGETIPGGGVVVYAGISTLYQDSELAVDGEYFYRIWSVDAGTNYSAALSASALSSVYREGVHILHVNDVHSRLTPHDYDITGIHDVPVLEKVGGAAFMAAKMLELKAVHPGALVLDAGDVSEGSVLGDLGYNRGLIDFYNALDAKLKALGGRGIDAAVVGNHDVRHISMISNMLHRAEFPFISMNIVYRGTTDRVFPPYVTVAADGKKVGILGYTTDTSSHLEETTENVLDVLTCSWNNGATDIRIKDYVDELRNELHCDVVVLLMHVGHSRVASDASGAPQLVEDDGETAPPNVAIAGHWHTMADTVWQPSDINHKMIIAEAASYMQYIGEIALDDDGRYLDSRKNAIRCADIVSDPEVAQLVEDLKAEYAAHPNTHCSDTNIAYALDQVIGYSADELRLDKDKWFTHSEYPWAGDNTAGAWVADSMQWYIDTQTTNRCDLALQSGGGVRRDNAAGEITYLEIYETYPWVDDQMVLMQVAGRKIWDFIQEDYCGTSISQGWTVYADDGVITNITHNGADIDVESNYWVAVSTYMYAHDNDFSPGGWDGAAETVIDYSIRQTMIDYTSQFTANHPMTVPGPRYVMNTESAGRFRAVVTLVDDANTEPYFESAFVRLLSATADTVARRGGYVDENLVNADGSINVGNQLAEVMLYRSYLGFEEGVLTNGMVIDIEGEFGFHAGNPQFVDQNGIVADGVEFRIVGADPALAQPDFKATIAVFWDEWHENRYVQFEGEKSGASTVKDRAGREIAVYDEGAFQLKALPGNIGDKLTLSGVQTYRYTERRFRCSVAAATAGTPDYTPISSVDAIVPELQGAAPLVLRATASDSTEETFMKLLPVADTQVASGNPGYTFGAATSLYIQSATNTASAYGNERIWTRFDLSGLPSGVTVDSATLRLYCYDNYSATSDLAADAVACADDSWDEATLSWSTQPALGSVVASATLKASEEYVWHEWDVTGFVVGEASGDGLASLAIKPSVESSAVPNAFRYDSKEYGGGSAGPFLEVEYSGGPVTGGTVTNVAFHYRYSPDGLSWGAWTLAGNAIASPWTLSFDYPDGDGWYEFHSVATDNAGNVEPAPLRADAAVRYVADADEDGVADAWELAYFGSLANVTEFSDADGDGFLDGDECRAGTNPTNAASLLAITDMQNIPVASSNQFVVQWDSVSGKTYSVERADDLATGFTNIASGVSATPPVNTVTDAVNQAESAFYRIKLEE